MAGIGKFEDIEAWQDARILVKEVYKQTSNESFSRDFGLCNQIQRAAVSTMSNIAEGFGHNSDKEFRRYLYMAKASAAEIRSLLYVARDLKYIDSSTYSLLNEQVLKVANKIAAFIKYLGSKQHQGME